MKYADLHSHIIPYMDDGARDLDTAVQLVSACVSQNIDTIVLTPHFYPSGGKSVSDFIKKRDENFALLKNELIKRNIPMPEFRLGAEVNFDCDLSEVPDIERLTIEGTDYLLLEMPEDVWQMWMFDYIYNLIAQKNVTPIIAHAERYIQTKEIMSKLKRLDVYLQINASSLLNKDFGNNAYKLLKNNDVHFIATDTHSLKRRPPEMEKAMEFIGRKFSLEYAEQLADNSYKVLENKACYKRESEYYTYKKQRRGFFGRFFR